MSAHIGRPQSRLDGRAKVTGAAMYAAEFRPRGLVHAVLVVATVAHGRIASIDTGSAERAPGALKVLTPLTFPRLDVARVPVPPFGQSYLPLQDERVLYDGQPVAVVIAETLEQAEHAATLVKVAYQREPAKVFGSGGARPPQKMNYAFERIEEAVGDVEAGLAEADVVITGTYTLPIRHHNPMEPSATIAEWDGDILTVHTATQWGHAVQNVLAALFGVETDNIRVRCPFTGGAFGCKGYVWPHQVIAAAAARELRRPVKLVLSRAQMYSQCGFQPAMRNRVRVGAKRDGRLTAIEHETENVTSVMDDYVEYGVAGTRGLYATPNLKLTARVEPANVGTPTAMRAPHEGPACSPSRRSWTSWPTPSASTPWSFASGTTRRSIRRAASPTPHASSGSATWRAPGGSAGPSVPCNLARCATGGWPLAGAWRAPSCLHSASRHRRDCA
jgi:xanthine dehydrogenase YagR molybdenum-binding subunit